LVEENEKCGGIRLLRDPLVGEGGEGIESHEKEKMISNRPGAPVWRGVARNGAEGKFPGSTSRTKG